MKDPLKSDEANVEEANKLPENAIVGSDSLNDTITGSYRRERILGEEGNDILSGGRANDRLEGGIGNDTLKGEKENDRLQGDEGNDLLEGGEGDDFAVFSDEFKNYNYSDFTGSTSGFTEDTIIFNHARGTQTDGQDILKDIEWAQFQDRVENLGNSSGEDNSETQAFASASAVGIAPRIIPLPLTDGVEKFEFIGAIDTTPSPNPYDPPTPPNVTVSAPVAMLDGDVDFTLNISPYELDTEYNNVVYVIDTSSSIDSVELQTIKDAYTDLTNFYIDEGIAENINFDVVSFDSNGRFYTGSGGDRNLTADEALVALQNLTTDTGIGTRYFDGLNQADQFLLNSRYNPFTTTGIGYFFTDGQK